MGEPFEGPIIPLGATVEYHPTSPKDQSRIHTCGKKVLPAIFLDYELIAEGIWKEDILIADMEELSKLDASDFDPRRINAKEMLIRQKDDEFIFPIADCTAKLAGRDYEFREPTPRQESTLRSEDLSEKLQGGSGEPHSANKTDDSEARTDFWSTPR